MEVFTLACMVVEGAVGLGAGIAAHALSLEAFGLDSVLELVSAAFVLWWLILAYRHADPDRTHDAHELAATVLT